MNFRSTPMADPYRLECEICGSSQVNKRGIDRKRRNIQTEFRFKCKNCKGSSKYAYDKKKGKSIHVTDL